MTGAGLQTIELRGLKSYEAERLDLSGLTVLIGENGAGKTALIEALELLRRFGRGDSLDQVLQAHGGPGAVQRHDAPECLLALEGSLSDGGRARYELSFDGWQVVGEHLTVEGRGADRISLVRRSRQQAEVFDRAEGALAPVSPPPSTPLLTRFSQGLVGDSAELRIIRTVAGWLRDIDVQVGFGVWPVWARPNAPLRASEQLRPVTTLDRSGGSLANAYHALKNSSAVVWEETLDTVRLGLGWEVEDILLPADPMGSSIGLEVRYRDRSRPISAAGLSEGTLAYLALVAFVRLHSARIAQHGGPSVIAFDEPELHLHPALLARVISLFSELAEHRPVIIATQSDRLLDLVSEPEREVVLVSRDEAGRSRLLRPNSAQLTRWLRSYRGLGEIRAEGFEGLLFDRIDGPRNRGEDP